MSTKDSDFYRTMSMVIIGLAVFFVIIIIAANMVTEEAGEKPVDPRIKAKIDEVIKPVGQVQIEQQQASAAPSESTASASAGAVDGKSAYTSSCAACHATGAAGAPKVGDKAAWKDRIAQGKKVLAEHAIKGFQGKSGMMPPRGGSSLNDDAIKAVIDYMVSQSK